MKERIRIAVAGLGNCASALIQGIYYYRKQEGRPATGLVYQHIGGYGPGDIEVVAAFDIDERKIGKEVNQAIFALPNCTTVFCPDLPDTGVAVSPGPVMDGYSDHLSAYPEDRRFLPYSGPGPSAAEVVRILKASGARVLMNYLPVGSEAATRFYAQCALDAGLAFVNNIPVFIASNPEWAGRFARANLPLIGDDIMSQLGATVTHRALTELFKNRGVRLQRTYQLNTGGNTDFLNMLNRDRLAAKKESKTEAVQAVAAQRLNDADIHVGPSDYVAWQNDNKVCFIRMEGSLFGDVPMNLELRLSVEDSPNSAGAGIDLIRCAALSLETGQGGILEGPCAFYCKHPPVPHTNEAARQMVKAFVEGAASQVPAV